MQHISIQAVVDRAASFEAFASHSGLSAEESADYRARAANLREFAAALRSHRAVDAQPDGD